MSIMKGTVVYYTLAILLSLLNGVAVGMCNTTTDRHCQAFPEQNVESITVIRT
jgi:hypothetical protein